MAVEDPRPVDGLVELFEAARLRLDERVPMLDILPKGLLRVAGEVLLRLAVAACSDESVRSAVELPSEEADVLRQAALREVEWPEETPEPPAEPQDEAVLVERRRRAHAERLLEDLGLGDDGRASWTLTAPPGETADALARLALEADS